MKLSDCPKSLRAQRLATLRLARAFRAHDRAEATMERARANLDTAFSKWSAKQSTNRADARSMLELAGMVERRAL